MQIRAIKTEDLTGAALDWAVADAIGLPKPDQCDNDGQWRRWYQPTLIDGEPWGSLEPFHPSINYSQGAPLIERFSMMIDKNFEEFSTPEQPWFAQTDFFWGTGQTVLIAICRAVVRRQLGDTVSVPAELLESA
ncbi:phage protein NinX family protein [Pantoea septica]|uniref:phage protein NinX family protein n=1 Tax=Pantoea septica TaxID=472695 RepID=UPI0023F71B8C|nr:phage protein NinX family protein [Pantoea septica]